MVSQEKTVLVFGAGNIGRGFLGLELYRRGYDIIFADSYEPSVSLLNKKRQYAVEIAETRETINVPIKKAILVSDNNAVNNAVQEASLITTAVGSDHLKEVGYYLARSLVNKATQDNFLDIIACENMIGNSQTLKKYVMNHLPTRKERDKVATFVGFPNSVVDRISIPSRDNTCVEKNFEWVADGTFWKAYLPPLCIDFVAELDPFLKRKLYLLNGAHATIGYTGKKQRVSYVHEAMQNNAIRELVLGQMEETRIGLAKKYNLSNDELLEYQNTILKRFENPLINDSISRLVRGQIRKLAMDERLVGPALLSLEAGVEPINIAKSIGHLLNYHDEDYIESVRLYDMLKMDGITKTLYHFTGLNPENNLHAELIKIIERETARI